jgi:signal transduction histidine kinase
MRRSGVGRSSVASTSRASTVAPTPLAQALADAARETCATLAQARQARVAELREQLDAVVQWATGDRAPNVAAPRVAPPPAVPHEYVELLRSALLERLASTEVDGRDLVRVLGRLEQVAQAWKETDCGRFVSRLTGTDSADAVVAVAHDIRSPLTSILILVDSLRRGQYGPGDPARDRQLGIIYGAAQGLATLAADLIDTARGDRLTIGPATAFSVTEAMSCVGQILHPVSEARAIPLRLHPPAIDARIGHAAALQRVLLNLASNALRCTETGFVAIAAVEAGPTKMEFSVTDTGPGIPADVLQRLFDGFRSERMTLRFSSAGLGLAIVRTLLAAMGSVLQIETAPGRGARFFFELELPHAH